MSANQWGINTPTVIDPTLLAHYNAGIRRARDANPELEPARTIPCGACHGKFATARGLQVHVARHCPRRAR